MCDSEIRTTLVAESHSTDKRLLLEDSGLVHNGQKRRHLVITRGIAVEDDTFDQGSLELARFSLTKQRAQRLIELLKEGWD